MHTVDYTKDKSTMFKRPADWMEVLVPAMFTFEKVGDTLTGTLLDMRYETIENRDVLTMRMETANGEQVKFRPSFDLRQKIGKRHLGKKLFLVYDSDLATGKENGLKMFRVFVAPEGAQDSEAPFVATEADLPEFQ